MKRFGTIVTALLVLVTLTQCKKVEQPTPANGSEAVTITLDLKSNGGSRVDVNTTTGEVTYQNGDVIYVASGGHYIGALTYNGTNFTGGITDPIVGEPLHFYFLGNVAPAETLAVGTTTTCSVVITDQTEHLPVIEYAPSNENYDSGATSYTAMLMNKCALVKFNVTTASEAATCITGMKNKVTVDFAENTLTHSQEGNGIITLPAGSGEKWAILLPQEAVEAGEDGTAYSEDGAFTGTRGAVPAIRNNGYQTMGIDIMVSTPNVAHEYVDLGLPSGLLWATCNVGANAPEEYGDYFAWGETQPKNYYDWSTYIYGSNWNQLTKYCSDFYFGYNGFTDNLTILLPEDDVATANWGIDWRMPTKEEWQELYNNTTCIWTQQNGVNGCLFTANNGNSFFLPTAGCRLDSSLYTAGYCGYYWSSSLYTGGPTNAWGLRINSDNYSISIHNGYYRFYGQSVRAVRSGL